MTGLGICNLKPTQQCFFCQARESSTLLHFPWLNLLLDSLFKHSQMKLSGEDADIVGKWFKVVNNHSTMKDVLFSPATCSTRKV